VKHHIVVVAYKEGRNELILSRKCTGRIKYGSVN
jgi:hypothetical protein